MNPNTGSSEQSIGQANKVDENCVQENPGLNIKINKDEPELKPHYICSLWTQLTTLIGINLIDANLLQPIILPEDCQAFLAIVTALGQPESDLNNFCNQFHTHTPIDTTPMKSLPPMVCLRCYILGEYICSYNYAPNDLHCAFSITGNEVEAWSQEH